MPRLKIKQESADAEMEEEKKRIINHELGIMKGKEGEGEEGIINHELGIMKGKEGEGERHAKIEYPFIIKVCDGIITLSFALIFLGVPLFYTGLTLQGMNFEKLMFFYMALLLGFFAWILKAILEGKIVVKRTPLDIPIIIFILVALASSFFSVNRWASFLGSFGLPEKSFIGILAFSLFYWLLISNINKRRLKVILASLAVSIGLVSLFAALNFFNINIIGAVLGLFGIRAAWTQVLTANAGFNMIGLLSNLQIFASAGILAVIGILGEGKESQKSIKSIKSKAGGEGGEKISNPFGKLGTSFKFPISKIIKDIMLYAILILLFLTIIVLGNFTSLIGLLIGLGVIIILAMAHLVEVDKKVFGICSLLFALTLVYIISGKPPVTLRNLPQEVGLSRQISWQISKDTFREKYLLGTGLGNFENSFNKFKPATFNNNALWNTRFSEATGIFYESLATMGGVGTVFLILLILTFLGVCLYFVLYRKEGIMNQESGIINWEDGGTGDTPFLFVALFAACITLGIDNALYLTGGTLLIFTIIITSLTMSIIAIYKKEYFKDLALSYTVKPEYALALSFVFVCLSCGMILIFCALGKVYLADVYAKSALSSDTEEMAVHKLNRAIKLSPYQYMYYEKLGDLLARIGDKEVKSGKGDMEKVQSLFIDALNSHKKAVSLSPENAFSWENLGVLSEAIVQYDPSLLNDADKAYSKAIELDPNNPALKMRLGVVREAKGDLAANTKQNETENEATQKNIVEVVKKLYGEAVENFSKAIELKPDLTSGYDAVSRVKEKTGNLDDAIKYMTASYQLNRKNAFYSFNLGRLFYNRAMIANNARQNEMATSTAEIAEEGGVEEEIEKQRNKEIGENNKTGNSDNDFKNAEALFKQAISIELTYVDALYSIAMLYEHQGNRNEAKEYYRKTLDALPENSEARKAVETKIGSF